jgi:hypothetical protein
MIRKHFEGIPDLSIKCDLRHFGKCSIHANNLKSRRLLMNCLYDKYFNVYFSGDKDHQLIVSCT